MNKLNSLQHIKGIIDQHFEKMSTLKFTDLFIFSLQLFFYKKKLPVLGIYFIYELL